MAINSSDADSPAPGWPFVNYAQRDRNLNTDSRPLSIPRFKFTYLVEFQLNPEVVRNPVTNINEFERNGRIYTHLKTIDYPRATHVYETLRSYNKYIKIPMKAEYPAASMTFDDDSTSIIQTLWKEYENFYTHAGSIGDNLSAGTVSNLGATNDANSFQLSDILVGEEVRANMDTRPSLGMKLKANDQRHFFEAITIYDLGTEPQGINVHWFHRPVFTSWEHVALEKEDRTGKVEITVPFEYEGYYFAVGQNRGRIRDFMSRVLDFVPPTDVDFIPEPLSGIGRRIPRRTEDSDPEDLSNRQSGDFEAENASLTDSEIDDSVIDPENGTRFPVEEPDDGFATDEIGTPTRDRFARDLESADESRSKIDNELARKDNEIDAAENNPNTSSAKLEQLERERQALEGAKDSATSQINESRRNLEEFHNRERANPATLSAEENTKRIRSSIPPPRPVTTAATNPNNQARLDKLLDSIPRVEQQAQTFQDLADANRLGAQLAADRGNNIQASAARNRANFNDARATEQLAIANRLRDTADSLTP